MAIFFLSPASHPIDADAGQVAQAAGKCGRVMLDVPDVDDLVFQRGHLIPGEAALRGREIERINSGIDHVIALLAVFEEVIASKRLTSLGRTVPFPRNTADVLCFLAMPSPWTKSLLSLLEVKMSKEERVVRNSPEWSGAIRRVVPHPVRAFLDYRVQGLKSRVILRLEGRLDIHGTPPKPSESAGNSRGFILVGSGDGVNTDDRVAWNRLSRAAERDSGRDRFAVILGGKTPAPLYRVDFHNERNSTMNASVRPA
jgi:hypothetical protein